MAVAEKKIGLQTRIDKVKLDVDLLKAEKHRKAKDQTGDAGGQAAGEATIDLRQASSSSCRKKSFYWQETTYLRTWRLPPKQAN